MRMAYLRGLAPGLRVAVVVVVPALAPARVLALVLAALPASGRAPVWSAAPGPRSPPVLARALGAGRSAVPPARLLRGRFLALRMGILRFGRRGPQCLRSTWAAA
jgi:hypothetical protein